jgi:hypothetical protein
MKVGNEFQIGTPNVLVTRRLMFGTLDVDIVVSNYTRTVGDIDDRKKIQRSNDVIRQLWIDDRARCESSRSGSRIAKEGFGESGGEKDFYLFARRQSSISD